MGPNLSRCLRLPFPLSPLTGSLTPLSFPSGSGSTHGGRSEKGSSERWARRTVGGREERRRGVPRPGHGSQDLRTYKGIVVWLLEPLDSYKDTCVPWGLHVPLELLRLRPTLDGSVVSDIYTRTRRTHTRSHTQTHTHHTSFTLNPISRGLDQRTRIPSTIAP